ncbi:hypothetical protein [Pararhodobacter sp. SW119]|uniref:hypothetical protein n=1 Tax=Pararhodobacter sp. SW119 TaxID=2780075 RepID=UPI001ADF0D5E|nr:hypothetical protein [Pararhodobacter sp. SW119]
MRLLPLFLAASFLAALAPRAEAGAQLSLRLDQVTQMQAQCQLVFVLESGLDTAIDDLRAETVLLTPENRVLRLTLLDFQSLPQNGLRVRSFNLPDVDCAQVGRVLINAISSCTPLDADQCSDALVVHSDTDIEVLK